MNKRAKLNSEVKVQEIKHHMYLKATSEEGKKALLTQLHKLSEVSDLTEVKDVSNELQFTYTTNPNVVEEEEVAGHIAASVDLTKIDTIGSQKAPEFGFLLQMQASEDADNLEKFLSTMSGNIHRATDKHIKYYVKSTDHAHAHKALCEQLSVYLRTDAVEAKHNKKAQRDAIDNYIKESNKANFENIPVSKQQEILSELDYLTREAYSAYVSWRGGDGAVAKDFIDKVSSINKYVSDIHDQYAGNLWAIAFGSTVKTGSTEEFTDWMDIQYNIKRGNA